MNTEKRIRQSNKRAQRLIVAVVVAGFLAAALLILQAVALSQIVYLVFLENQTLGQVLPILIGLVLLAFVRAGLLWASEIISQSASNKLKGDLRYQLARKLLELGPVFTRQERAGELTNTAVDGIETLDAYLTQYLPARYLAVAVPVAVFLVVLFLDPWTTLVLLFAGPMLLLLLALIGGRAKELTERRFREMSWMSAFFLDMLQGLGTLKLFGRSREQAENIREISQQYGRSTMDVLRTAFQTSLVMEWAATAATAMVALEVSLRLMNGALPFNRALAVLLLTPEFFLPLRQMALKYHAGTSGKAAADRLYSILDQPALVPAIVSLPSNNMKLPVTPRRFDIHFDDVYVAYENGRRPALKGLSLYIRHGSSLALVGETGAGKSTICHLLLKFIVADEGSVTVDGLPLAAVELGDWRRQVGWIPQHPHLFHGTVADNIRIARPETSFDSLVAAAKAAHADQFIRALPQGYETIVGERGAKLSGGQRQRLAIARAFLKDAPFLILDEATAYLDIASEELVQETLQELMRDRTVLIIAHRLRMAFAADAIALLDNGRLTNQGSHQTLLAESTKYRQLVSSYAGAVL